MAHFFTAFLALLSFSALAVPLERAKITELVNDVRIIERSPRATRRAQVTEEFRSPDVMRTGANSRAEMISPDQTVVRVGSNTLFSFEPDSREIELQKGSILFHSPSGRGGGTIRTSAASAAVLGTTLIVSATSTGAMKVMLLEGRGKVTVPGRKSVVLSAGQLALVLPGGRLSPVVDFQLSRQVADAKLVRGFRHPLQSGPRVAEAVQRQERRIGDGKLGPRDPSRPPPRKGGTSNPPPKPPPPPPPTPAPGGVRPDVAIQAQKADDKRKPPPPPPPPKQKR